MLTTPAVAELVVASLDHVAQCAPGSTHPLTVVDLGSGHGVLLAQVDTLLRERGRSDVRLIGVDLRPRPDRAPASIDWVQADVREYLASTRVHRGVLIAHELLDDVPLVIVERAEDGVLRRVDADPTTGAQVLGPLHDDPDDVAWLARWWPVDRPLARAEVGRSRDALWQQMLHAVDDGICIAVDYGHLRDERIAGTWDGGTCVGYRAGRAVSPVADGSCNLTAHVAFDALTAVRAPTDHPVVMNQQSLAGDGAPDLRIIRAWLGAVAADPGSPMGA